MTAPRREISVHCRLHEQADSVLEALALASNKDKSAIASELLHAALLGAGHNLRLAAERMLRSGLIGSGRE